VDFALSSLFDELVDRGHGFTSFVVFRNILHGPQSSPKKTNSTPRKTPSLLILHTKRRPFSTDKAYFSKEYRFCQTFEGIFSKHFVFYAFILEKLSKKFSRKH